MYNTTPSCPPPAGPMTVVGPQFTVPCRTDLLITKKFSLDRGSFVVTDNNGNHILKVKKKGMFSTTILLIDNAGNSVISLRPKIFSLRRSWRVYKRDSSDPKDLLFKIKDSHFIQFKNRLNVFLAENTNQKVPDFIIKPSWSGFSCTICLGDSSTIIARMHKKSSFTSIIQGKNILAVTVNPNIDYAFIIALLVVLYEKSRSNS